MKARLKTLAALLLLALPACARLPELHLSPAGMNYKPLAGEEVAEIAVPQAPAADPSAPALACRVSKGAARFGEKWLDFSPADFSLPPDTRITVTLVPLRPGKKDAGEVPFQSWYGEKTQEMLFCPVVDGPPDKKIPCAGIYALDEDLDAGIKRTFDIPGAVEGGVLTCARSPDQLKP